MFPPGRAFLTGLDRQRVITSGELDCPRLASTAYAKGGRYDKQTRKAVDGRKSDRPTDRPTDHRPTDLQTHRPTDRQTDRPTDLQTTVNAILDVQPEEKLKRRISPMDTEVWILLFAFRSIALCWSS